MADTEKLNRKIGEIESRLDQQIARTKAAQTTTIVIGVVLVIVIIGYFSYMAGRVRDLMQPEDLAQMAGDEMVDRAREFLPQIEQAARENTPRIVDELVDEVLKKQLPHAREVIESTIREEADRQFEGMAAFIIEQFNEVMDMHEDNINALVEMLETSEGRLEFEQLVYAQMEEALADEMIAISIDSYGEALEEIHQNMTLLTLIEYEEMDPLQKATFDLVAVVRELANRSEFTLEAAPDFPMSEEIFD